MKYIIPTSNDATEILMDRVLIITGVGRSGTTILGKIIGSMSLVYYLFEPAIMKWLIPPSLNIKLSAINGNVLKWVRAIVFEDYFLPIVQGRHLNNNPKDWSYWRYYYERPEVIIAQNFLNRRKDAIAFLKKNRPLFVIKSNELQFFMRFIEQVFPGCRFIHIVRNGNDVVNSAIGRDWYMDEWCNNYMMDWAINGKIKAPWYLDKEDVERWPQWKPITRAACAWRYLVNLGLKFAHKNLFYENFIDDPEDSIEDIKNDFSLQITENTEKHFDSIHAFKQKTYPNIIDEIEEPERSKFMKVMSRCGYE